jgi:exopolyphosphatase/guanosine-5'-triphosphate,3'-diphosphate pyrophosphatase
MSPRRSAFIDVGTNTLLCLIAELRDTGRFRVLDDLAEITRLGEGVDRTGEISAAGEQRSLEVLRFYRDRCKDLGVEEIIAVGTSALRDARNGADVCARFHDQLGFEIQIITGDQEAAYSFLAVQRGLGLSGQELLVVDVGGGSTEFIRGSEIGVSRALSLNLGSVRLTERFIRSDPVRTDEMATMVATIDRELLPVRDQLIQEQGSPTLVGIAATFTTLVAVEKKLARYSHSEVHGSTLTMQQVRRQLRLYAEKTLAERRTVIGLEPKRADVIFAGVCLIERIMSLFHADQVIVSDQGVRYGLLYRAAIPR